jgi:hypothetical protein
MENGATWLAQFYLIFVQSALADADEIVQDCPLTLDCATGKLAPMFTRRTSTSTMMTATPKRVAVASS